jgi:hypothetical protein
VELYASPAHPVLRRSVRGECGLRGGEWEDCRPRLQRSASAPSPAAGSTIAHDVVHSAGAPLDGAVREAMEPRFGHSFADVRVHTDRRAADAVAAVGALAYTVGSHVVFGAGRYVPNSGDGRRLLAHELAHVVQQSGSAPALRRAGLAVGPVDAPEEREADAAADAVLRGGTATVSAAKEAFLQRSPIHKGMILDEGSCEHLACNSKWACENASGVACPDGTRNANSKTKKKFSPLFTCDTTCEEAKGCSDSANWMAIPRSRFERAKCGQDLVICANERFTHATVRDRSDKQAWEVGHGVQDALAVAPYATFTGVIYGDENDAAFKTDEQCGNAKKAEKPDAGPTLAPDAGLLTGEATPAPEAGTAEVLEE